MARLERGKGRRHMGGGVNKPGRVLAAPPGHLARGVIKLDMQLQQLALYRRGDWWWLQQLQGIG